MYIDIHSHIIWGVDDGAKTREQTFDMLRAAAADGIEKIICTPHNTPGVLPFPEKLFQEHLAIAKEFIQREGLNIQLTRGAEIFYTEMTPRFLREGKTATMEGSRYALIEFSPTETWEKIRESLHRVTIAGFTPVLAHIERYGSIHKTSQVEELREFCCARIQVNARTLLRKQPLMRRAYFDSLFRENLVDFIATDTHALPGRDTCMREGLETLRERYGEACLLRIQEATKALFGEKRIETHLTVAEEAMNEQTGSTHMFDLDLNEQISAAQEEQIFNPLHQKLPRRRRSDRYLNENS